MTEYEKEQAKRQTREDKLDVILTAVEAFATGALGVARTTDGAIYLAPVNPPRAPLTPTELEALGYTVSPEGVVRFNDTSIGNTNINLAWALADAHDRMTRS